MKAVFYFLVTILTLGNIYAQQVTIYQSGINTIVRYINASGGYDYTYNVFHSIGRDDGNNGVYSGSQEDIWRSEHSFYLGAIPSGATITQAQLQFFVSGYQCSTCSLKVTKTTGQYSYDQLWTNINNTNTIVSNYVYNSTTPVVSTALKDAIIAALATGTLYLGSMSLVEGANNSYAALELRLIVDYTVPPSIVNITAQNNFIYGTIKVGVNELPIQRNSPFPFNPYTDQAVNLEAQNQSYGGYERVWNNYMPTYQSNWQKQILPNPPIVLDNSQNINYSFTASTGDNNSYYIAGLRKNFKIDQTHTTEFDGNQTEQNTSWIVEQNSDNISTQSSRLINGKNYLFAGWEDNLALPNTRNISPVDNETYNVLYKYPHHSNSTAAYSSNSHRKFIQTPDGVKHIC